MLRQHDAAAVQQRQQVAVEVGLGLLRDLVAEAMPAERLLDELAAKMVAGDLGDAIELAERGELVDDSLRRERRPIGATSRWPNSIFFLTGAIWNGSCRHSA